MPQCICGNFFSTTSYKIDNKEDDICPKCKDSTSSTSYVSSYEWTCENSTSLLLDSTFSLGAGSHD